MTYDGRSPEVPERNEGRLETELEKLAQLLKRTVSDGD